MPISSPKLGFTLTNDDFDKWDAENAKNAQLSQPNNMPSSNPAANMLYGVGDALRNTFVAPANLIPGVNIPLNPSGSGLSYDVGNIAGNIAGFLGGGEVLDTARLLGEGLPYIGKAAQYLGQSSDIPSLLKRAIGSGIYGSSNEPNDKSGGFESGVGLSALMDALPIGMRSGVQALSPIVQQYMHIFNPDKYAESIINNISGGQGIEESGKNIASNIKNNYEIAQQNSKNMYKPLYEKYGNQSIYEEPNMSSYLNLYKKSNLIKDTSSNNYLNLPGKITNSYNSGVSDLHDEFINNPNLENAIELRKGIDTQLSNLYNKQSKGNLSSEESSDLDNLADAKNSLMDDINSFFDKNNDPGDLYRLANNDWRQNVLPYRQDNDIFKMAKGDIANPTNIASIFRNPEPSTLKVVSDLPDNSKDNIIYSSLGSQTAQKSAQNLINAYKALDQKGLSSFASPQLQQSMKNLSTGISFKNAINKVGGAYIGSHIPFMPEEIGAIAGYKSAPFLSRILFSNQKGIPGAGLPKAPVSGMYDYLRNALLPTYLSEGQRSGT